MQYQVSFTQKSQLTIPKDIRKSLGLQVANPVVIDYNKAKKTIKLRQPDSILSLGGIVNKTSQEPIQDAVKLRDKMTKEYRRK